MRRLFIYPLIDFIIYHSAACHLDCTMGKVNAECEACTCEGHVLLGSVRGAGGLIAEGAAVLRSGKLLVLTDHNGHFRIPGVCPDGNTTLTVSAQNHAPLDVLVPLSSEATTVLSVRLERTGNRRGRSECHHGLHSLEVLILISICLSAVGSRGQQLKLRAPNFPFPGPR